MGQKFDSVGESSESKPNRQKMDTNYCKILTLGTGFSGKSTLYFQVNKLNNSQEEEMFKITESYVSAVLSNLNDLTCEVGQIAIDKFSDKFEDEKIIDQINHLKSLELNTFSFVKEGVDLEQSKKNHAKVLKDTKDYKIFAQIWNEPIMWEVFRTEPLLTRFDGSDYLLEKTMPKIDKDFLPTEEDIFSCRKKTTGITSIQFTHSGVLFHYFDVGGQKNERKKWQKVFKNVDLLIYIISLSDYDETIYEQGEGSNRMLESLETFEKTINGEWFSKTPILLVYNKKDLLTKKIQKVDKLKDIFPKYKGDTDPEQALEYITSTFNSKIQGNKDRIETIITNIILPDQVEECLNFVQSKAPTLTLRKTCDLDPSELKK